MPRRRFYPEEIRQMKFEECISCQFALTKTCRECDMGEHFEDCDQPQEVVEQLKLWE